MSNNGLEINTAEINTAEINTKENNKAAFRETDIRPDGIIEKQQKFIEADRNALLAKKEQFISVPCPACKSTEGELSFEKNGFSYFSCKQCGTLYISPRPGEELLGRFYENSEVYKFWNEVVFPASDDARSRYICAPRVSRIIEICRKHGVVADPVLMEVGAGHGTFCQEAFKSGFFGRIVAVEPSASGAESCRRKNVEVIQDQVENVHMHTSSVDIVVSFEVIEHLFSPEKFVLECTKILKTNGLLVLTCPNIKGFDNLVLGKSSSSVDHEHLNYFTPESLSHLLTSCGLTVLEKLTPGELDAELVRKQVLRGDISLEGQPFLQHILIEKWEELGGKFQKFLAENRLSGHLWIVAQRKDSPNLPGSD